MDYADHYNKQYADEHSDYAGYYHKPLPEWAVGMNNYGVHFAAAVLNLIPGKDRILDVGSGMGYFLDAWELAGFEPVGVEVSEEAVKRTSRTNIICRSACDLSCFEDDSFSVVFSSAFLEHIADEDCERMMKEFMRVAPFTAHYIAHEKGADEGHINIKSPSEWLQWMNSIGMPNLFAIPNPLVPTMPLIVSMREMPAHFAESYHFYWNPSQ